MASRRRSSEAATKRRSRATTPEARENEMAALAYDVAEQQMREGTASSQVITHFLKAGSLREQLEQERIAHENELLKVKKDAMESQKNVERLYTEAIDAMRRYQGVEPSPDDDHEE